MASFVAGRSLRQRSATSFYRSRGKVVRSFADARSPPAEKPPLPPQPSIKAALCQLDVGKDKNINIEVARKSIKEAAENGATLVVLPEMWNCPYANESFPVYAEDIEGGASPSADMMSEIASEAGVVLVGGSIPEREGDNLYNTCCVFGSDGKLLGKHRKTHLFDIDIPGKITFQESKTLTAGGEGTVVDTPVGRLGIGICFDVRFPELAMLYASRGAHLLVYPGAFNTVTGPLHWELLHRCRAVDNQMFMLACSPARVASGEGYQAWGHSTAFGPFGETLGTCDEKPTIVYADIDFDQLYERRQNMPLNQQRRGDLYTLCDRANLSS